MIRTDKLNLVWSRSMSNHPVIIRRLTFPLNGMTSFRSCTLYIYISRWNKICIYPQTVWLQMSIWRFWMLDIAGRHIVSEGILSITLQASIVCTDMWRWISELLLVNCQNMTCLFSGTCIYAWLPKLLVYTVDKVFSVIQSFVISMAHQISRP